MRKATAKPLRKVIPASWASTIAEESEESKSPTSPQSPPPPKKMAPTAPIWIDPKDREEHASADGSSSAVPKRSHSVVVSQPPTALAQQNRDTEEDVEAAPLLPRPSRWQRLRTQLNAVMGFRRFTQRRTSLDDTGFAQASDFDWREFRMRMMYQNVRLECHYRRIDAIDWADPNQVASYKAR